MDTSAFSNGAARLLKIVAEIPEDEKVLTALRRAPRRKPGRKKKRAKPVAQSVFVGSGVTLPTLLLLLTRRLNTFLRFLRNSSIRCLEINTRR